MKKTLITITVLLGSLFNIYAQEDSTTQHLKEIFINYKRAVPERLKEIDDYSLYTGKKNEVIRIAAIDANLITNNSRQIFSRVPGVSIWENDGSGTQISVGARGLSPNRSWEFNTRQNGYDMSSDVFGYPEAYYNPPMEAVEKIQIIRGGASLQYGSQFGGLLNYILKRETNKKAFNFETQNGLGSYGLMSSYNAISGNTDKINYYVYNHYRKGNGWRENSKYDVRNTHAFFQYKFSDKTNLSIEYTNMDYAMQQSGGLTDAQFQENHQQSLRQRNWFGTVWNLASINLNTKILKNISTNIKIFGLIGERNSVGFLATTNYKDTVNTSINDYNYRQVDKDNYKNIGAEIRNIAKYKLGHQEHNLAFGARLYEANMKRFQKGNGTTEFDFNTTILDAKFPTALKFNTKNLAFFAENQFKLSSKFSITPGIRFENITSSITGRSAITNGNDINVIPQTIQRNTVLLGIGMEYKLITTNFYANFSQAFRPVLFSDLTPLATTDVIDVNLKDANGFNAELGYRGFISDYFSFDISAFYIHYNNRIGSIRKYIDNDPSKATYQYKTNLGLSTSKGLEAYFDLNLNKAFGINKKIGLINFFNSLSFIDASYSDFKVSKQSGSAPNIIITEENLRNNKVEYAPTYIHNIGLTYVYKGFSTTIQTRLNSSVFTDATNTVPSDITGRTGKIDAYQVCDISLDYKFSNHYNVKAGINNFTNTKYATRRSGGYPGPGLIPGEGRTFYLSIGVKI